MLSEDSFKLVRNIIPIKKKKSSKEINIFLNYFYNLLIKNTNTDSVINEIKYNNNHYNFDSKSNFLSIDVKKQIESLTYKTYNFKFKLKNTLFDIKFITLNDANISIIYYYLKQIYNFYMLLSNLSFLKNRSYFKIVIFFSDIKKTKPKDKLSILNVDNVNTGYTYCNSNEPEIVLYRNEEWFKVLIHETMHAIGLDFCNFNNKQINDSILKIFPINIKLNLYETYCEIWAILLNIVFISFEISNSFEGFKKIFMYNYNFENCFQIFQMNKVLDFMNLKYDELYSKNEKYAIKRQGFYREKTNVFCYYILKCILFNNLSEFLLFCKKNNRNYMHFSKTEKNLTHFSNLIKDNYNNESFLKIIKNISNKYNSKINKNSYLHKTLRLSIFDYVHLY